ncbi:MAG: hypothetical protein NW208_09725 [Bryobacter sp.]|nr:hypothetical protein [Bryobacter sp.]
MRFPVLLLALAALAFQTSCSRYANFEVPPAENWASYSFEWRVNTEPVLTRGSAVDVLNPSVALWAGSLLNLYSRFDGEKWESWMANSSDGLTWSNHRRVLTPEQRWEGKYIAANGSLIVDGGRLLYFYQAGPKGQTTIGLATSSDGQNWTKRSQPIFRKGPRLAWDEISMGDPYAWRAGEYLFLCYLGEDRAGRQRLGLARSRDAESWEKLQSNPVMELGGSGEFDENGLGEPAIFSAGGKWVMLYTGRDRKEIRRMGYATSTNGVKWTKVKSPVLAGEQSWNRQVLCDATVLVEEDRVRVWFGGGDQPKPDERINGQIGYAELPRK